MLLVNTQGDYLYTCGRPNTEHPYCITDGRCTPPQFSGYALLKWAAEQPQDEIRVERTSDGSYILYDATGYGITLTVAEAVALRHEILLKDGLKRAMRRDRRIVPTQPLLVGTALVGV